MGLFLVAFWFAFWFIMGMILLAFVFAIAVFETFCMDADFRKAIWDELRTWRGPKARP